MALKDLKSILSDFRIPKKTPLADRDTGTINKGGNQTPLGGMIESTPKVAVAKTTPNKSGADTTPIKQGDKFKGETNPTPMDNSTKFLGETNTKPMSLEERYLGETSPIKSETTEKFLGETNPTKMDSSEKFLGETNPTKMDISEKFLGETTPNPANNTSNFLGETTPNLLDNSSNFLGETTPTPSDNSSHFLGETTPNLLDNSSNFLGETTPNPANNTSNFLGETTPTPSNNSSNFLGETTPTPSDSSPNFLGETTPSSVNYFSDIHATGFTSPFGGVDASKYVGVNPDNTVFNGSTSLFGAIGNINGFTPNLSHRAPSKFTGVDSAGTLWDSKTSIFSNHTLPDTALSFGTGYKEFQSKKKSGNTQQYTPDSANYEASYKSIGTTMEQRNSPSFLDLMYAKYNLREDAYNSGLTLFNHPLILRGIQRKGISKGEPQNWGIGGVTFDDGHIRGGVITSTVRASIDVARIGAWMASIKGILWGARQAGLQLSQKFGRVWTPAGLLASVGGQHTGLHAQRPGLIPLVDDRFHYQNNTLERVIKGNFKDKLQNMFEGPLGLQSNVIKLSSRFLSEETFGGFDSVYGIGFGGTRRYVNTIDSHQKWWNDSEAWRLSEHDSEFNFPSLNPNTREDAYANAVSNHWGKSYDDKANKTQEKADDTEFSLKSKHEDRISFNGGFTPKGVSTTPKENRNAIVQDYETIAYGDIPDRVAGNGEATDFRLKLTKDNVNRKIADDKATNYTDKNINKRVHFANPGLVAQGEDRYTWWNTDPKTAGNKTRFDKIQASDIDDPILNDLVHLYFMNEDDTSKIQFKGTLKGILDTFTPSWEGYKYNGRADSAYQYKSFSRSVAFNMQVYATSRIEMKPIYSKLGRLASMTMPTYGDSAGYQGSIIKFRLGNLYVDELAYIDSLSYSMSDEAPWDISLKGSDNFIGELPMGIDVSITLKILGKEQPKYGMSVYSGY